MNELFGKLLERSHIFLVIIGIILLLIGAAGGITIGTFSLQIIEPLWRGIVGCLGLILTGIGVFLVWRDVQSGSKTKASAKGKSTVTAFPLFGLAAIYRQCSKLIKECNGNEVIRSTSLGIYPDHDLEGDEEKEWRIYLEILASKIKQAKDKKLDMIYKTILGYVPDENGIPPPHKQRMIVQRRKIFKEKNAIDRIEFRYVENTFPLDILIIGKEHLIIAFPTIPSNRGLRLGIRLSGKEFVENTCRWYDEFFWNKGNPVTWTGE